MLTPTLHAGDIVVMDNLGSHKAAGVPEAIEAMGSKVKQSLRGAVARTRRALLKAIGDALRSVTLDNYRGFFNGCGYGRYTIT